MENYKKFRKVQEVRRPKKCPVLNFRPIRESETYTDMIAMGFVEALPEKPAGIETEGPPTERHFKDRLGNIAFSHPSFRSSKPGYPQYNIQHNGSIRVFTGPSKSSEFPRLNTDLRRACMTVDDYLFKMGFLIKYLVRNQGFPMTDEELYGSISYKDLIRSKMEENVEVAKKIEIPPSLKKEEFGKGVGLLKRFGALGED